jgi:hypothetical protein
LGDLPGVPRCACIALGYGDLVPLDADLQRFLAAWGGLPAAIRAAITALIASQDCGQKP